MLGTGAGASSGSRPNGDDVMRGEFDLAHVMLLHEPLAAPAHSLGLIWIESRRRAPQARTEDDAPLVVGLDREDVHLGGDLGREDASLGHDRPERVRVLRAPPGSNYVETPTLSMDRNPRGYRALAQRTGRPAR